MLCGLVLLAAGHPGWSRADTVYHEQSTTEVVGVLEASDCPGPQAFLEVFTPGGTEAYPLRFRVQYASSLDRAAVYYTTNGSYPAGSRGSGSADTLVINASRVCGLTNATEVVDVRLAVIPAQPPGTIVRYIVSAWDSGGGDEIFGNSITCEDCLPFTNSVQATRFEYTVRNSPVILEQPRSQTNAPGSEATFTVSALGTEPLSFQWYFGEATALAGGTNATLLRPQVQAADVGSYRVVVSNAFGAVTSDWASLTVLLPPTITQQPADVSASVGGSASFSVTASGSEPLSYQWQFNGDDLPGATSPALSIDPVAQTHAGAYRVAVSNAVGVLTSQVALLTVLVPLSILQQPASLTVTQGQEVTFTVIADGTPPLTYQWWFGGNVLAERTEATLTLTQAQPGDAGSYQVVVSNVSGTVTSAVATLTIAVPPGITVQPQSQVVTQGQHANFSVAATGIEPLGYQWYFHETNALAEGTNAMLFLSQVQLTHAGPYRVVVSNAFGVVTSDWATLTVLVAPTILDQPASLTVVQGQDAAFTVVADGTPPLGFQWWLGEYPLPDRTAATLTLTNVQPGNAGAYRVVVSNVAGSVTSAVATLTVRVPPFILQQPASLTVSQGHPATFTVLADGDPPLTYQWWLGGNMLGGQTNAALTFSNAQPADAGSYQVVISNPAGSVTSAVATLTVQVLDFGDAPPGYPTLLAENGARHVLRPQFYLGSGVDAELDGQPSASALGDDFGGVNDEDGVSFTAPIQIGQSATVLVVASTNGVLQGWLDFNGDRDWNDAGEQIFTNRPVVPGTNRLTFLVSAAANPGLTFARFRFSSVGGLSFAGLAPDGEAEDYAVTLQATVDLGVMLSDLPDPVPVGGTITYLAVITNRGPSTATGVSLLDTLSDRVQFQSATASQGSCSTAGGTVTCALGSLGARQGATVTIVVRAPAPGLLPNTATVTGTEFEANPADNTSSQTTASVLPARTFANAQPLVLDSILTGPADVYPSRIEVSGFTAAVYRVTATLHDVSHSFPDDLDVLLVAPGGRMALVMSDAGADFRIDGVTLTFDDTASVPIPNSSQLVSGTFLPANHGSLPDSFQEPAPAGPYSATLGTFAGINPNGTWSLYVVDDTSEDGGEIAGGWSLSITAAEPIADLRVTQVDSPDPGAVGTNLLFSITVTNLGPANASAVTLSNRLPAGLDFVSVTTSRGTCSNANGTVTCEFGTLPNGAGATVSLVAMPALGGRFTNTVMVSARESDLDPTNNVASTVNTVTPVANLGLALSATPEPVLAGQPLHYSMRVTNQGPNTASGVLVSNALPPGMHFVAAVSSQGVCSNVAEIVSCALGTLASQASAVVTFTCRPSLVGRVTNTVHVSGGEYDPNPGDNTAAIASTVDPAADVALRMTASLQPVGLAQPLVYTMVLSNQGPNDTMRLTLQDVVPAGVSFVSVTSSQGVCTNANGLVTCELGPLMAGDAATVALTVIPTALGLATNTASVLTDPADPNPTNNVAAITSTVVPAANLGVTLSDFPDPVWRRETLTYTLSVANAGPSEATGVVLRDTLPANIITSSIIPSQGSCTNQAGIVTCNLGTLASGRQATVTVLLSPTLAGMLTNQALVTANELDVDATNNLAQQLTTVVTPGGIFSSPGPVTIPSVGPAAIYPSTITVLGLTAAVQQVRVTLTNLSHAYADDLDLLLVGPSGQSLLLMSDAGGEGTLINATLRFDDLAPQPLPDAGAIFSGLYKPTDYETPDIFPAPAPPGPHGTNLAIFNGTDPNGVWALYVVDDAAKDSGTLGGWRLDIAGRDPIADLVLSRADLPEAAAISNTLVFTIGLSNRGPAQATQVRLTDQLPPALQLLSVTASQGSCTHESGFVHCDLGTLPHRGNAVVTISAMPTEAATGTNLIAVTAREVDLNPSNNTWASAITFEYAPVITLQPSGFTVTNGESVVFLAEATGTEPLVYQWQRNGLDLPGETNTSLALNHVSPLDAGQFQLRVGNRVGTAFSQVATLAVLGPPGISDLFDQTIDEDTSTGLIPFLIADAESPAETLRVTGSSSNPDLLPDAAIFFTGSGNNRALRLVPAPDRFGQAVVSVQVTDPDNLVTISSFVLTVRAVNDPPVVGSIPDQVTDEDTPLGVTFTVEDPDLLLETLSFSGHSTDPGLVPAAGIVVTGTGNARTLTVTPAQDQSGAATVFLAVTDEGGATVTIQFHLTVVPVNDPPKLTAISPLVIDEDSGPQTVLIEGINSGAANEVQRLRVTASASPLNLLSQPTIEYSSPQSTGTLTFVPQTNAQGTATITVTVNDSQSSNSTASQTFTVEIRPINDPPTLSAIPDQVVDEDTAISLPLSVDDDDTPDSLSLSATSSNADLLPPSGVVFAGAGANRILTITPAADQFGTSTVTVSVTDTNGARTSAGFVLTVNPVNDPPTLAPLSDRVVNEDAGQQTVNLTGIGPGAANELQGLAVTATSSNPALISDPEVAYTSPAATGTLRFTPVPNASGTAVISVRVDDGQATNSFTVRTFTVTVNAFNDAPVVSPVASLSTPEDTPLTVPLTVSDADNLVSLLGLTASSSNTNLVPTANLFLDGAADSRTLTILPASNQSGATTITLTANDGSTNTSTTFALTVTPVNDWPTLDPIPDLTVDEGVGQFTVNLAGISSGATNETQTLAVSAVSSNNALVSVQSLTYASPTATGSLRLRAVGGGTGTALIAVTVNDGGTSNNLVTQTFTVFVKAVANTVPVISVLVNRATPEDTSIGPIGFTVTDVQTPAASLVVTATSSNPALVPNPNIILGGSGSNRTVTVTPAPNQTGTALITIAAVDAAFGMAADSFVLTVNPVNDPPAVTGLANQTVPEDSPALVVPFILSDADTPAAGLTVTARSSNAALVPDSNLRLGGSGTNRSLVLTLAANGSGSAIISLTVHDGQTTTSNGFVLTVIALNDPPTLSTIADQVTAEDTATPEIPLVIGDLESATDSLTVTGVSSNPGLVPDGNLAFSGSGSNRTLRVTPAPNQFGAATITVTVTDGGGASASHAFQLTVTPANDAPTLDAIPSLVLHQNVETQTVTLTGISAGPDNEGQTVLLTATSSDPALVSQPIISHTNPSTSGVLTFTRLPGAQGTARITVTVNDGQPQSNLFLRTFDITLTGAPTISEIPDQLTFEDRPIGPIAFLVGDAETPAEALVVTAHSSRTNLVSDANLLLGGSGATRTLTIRPNPNAWSWDPLTVTLLVTDSDGNSTSTRFPVTVIFVNDPPDLDALTDQTIPEDTVLGPLPFTASDTDGQAFTLTATSSDQTLVPDANITILSGLGRTYFLSLLPAANQHGTVTITTRMTDELNAVVSQSFVLTVLPVNDPPTLDPLPNLTLPMNASTQAMVLSGISPGPPNEHQGLTVTAVSSDPALMPHPQVDYTSPNPGGTLTLSPTRNAAGTAQITVTVQDDGDTLHGGYGALTRTFSVSIGQTNRSVLTVARGDGEVHLSFETVVGATYTVQYKDSVAATNWSTLVTRAGTGVTLTVSDRVVLGAHRIYRLRVDALPVGPSEPSRLTIAHADGHVNLSFKTEVGLRYTVLYRSAVTETDWSPLATRPGTGTTVTVNDPILSGACRFYRLRADPN